MADLVFNIAKGRVIELYNRVDLDDPTGAEFVVMAIDANGETDDNMRDADSFSALLALLANEVTNGSYARKILVAADLAAIAPDDTNNWNQIDLPDQTWTTIAAGDAWTDLVMGYDYLGTGVDANIIPLTIHDFAVTPDGSDITAQIDANGFFRAT